MEKQSPQAIFLLYALPVIDFCSGEKASQKEKQNLKDVIRNNTNIQTEAIKKHFPEAVAYIPMWTTKNVLDYWLEGHNKLKSNPLCQTYITKVGNEPRQYQNQNAIFKGKELIIPNYIEVNKGDIVSVHNFTIAQKLTPEILEKYFPKRK